MKLIIQFIFLSAFLQQVNAQNLYIVPNTGINLSAFGYRNDGRDLSSILTYPKASNINPGMGADIIYETNRFKHVLNFSSMPFGITFKGTVIREGTNLSSIIFSNSSFQRHLLVGYQFFVKTALSKPTAKRSLEFYYGAGFGIGFNRSKEFYTKNYININDGLRNGFDNHFYTYTYDAFRKSTAIFVMPEAGFTLYNKKKKPVINASFYYNIGLTEMSEFKIDLRYGNLNSSTYNFTEKQNLRTKGSVYGFKIGVPIKIFTFKKHAKL